MIEHNLGKWQHVHDGHGKIFTIGEKQIAMFSIDPLVQSVYDSLDIGQFVVGNISKLGLLLRVVPRALPRMAPRLMRNFRNPDRAKARWFEDWESYQTELTELSSTELPLDKYLLVVMDKLVRFVFWKTLPIFPCAKIAKARIEALLPDAGDGLDVLDQALSGNLTLEMGHELYRLYECLDGRVIDSAEDLAAAIQSGDLPSDFLQGWQELLEKYGHRGQCELDVASVRFRDDPTLFLQQIVSFSDQTSPLDNLKPVRKNDKRYLRH